MEIVDGEEWRRLFVEVIRKVRGTSSRRQALASRKLFLDGKIERQVALEMGVSVDSVRQLRGKGLDYMRDFFGEKLLELKEP